MSFDFYRLKNGVRVILVPMAGVESIAVGTYVGTGSRFETPEINGLSHFLEHMAFKGTKKFPTHKDTTYLEGLGAMQNAWTSNETTCFYCKIPADKWREGLEVVADLTLNPTIPLQELEIERGVILEEIRRNEDRPEDLVEDEIQKVLFAGNPLEMTVLGRPEVIQRVGQQDFVKYHDKQYVSGNIVVALAGKLENTDKIKTAVEKIFGDLPAAEGEKIVAFQAKQKKPMVGFISKKDAAQAHLELGVHGMSLSDPRRFALTVLTSYLGGGMSSRIWVEIREKRGLCYAIGASSDLLRDTGAWLVSAGLNTDKLEDAVEAILKEMKLVKDNKIGDKDLAEAKEKVRGPLLFSQENPIRQMDFFGRQALERPEEILTYEQVIEKIMSVDAETSRSVAQSLFLTRSLNLALVGPIEPKRAGKLQELLNLELIS